MKRAYQTPSVTTFRPSMQLSFMSGSGGPAPAPKGVGASDGNGDIAKLVFGKEEVASSGAIL